MSEVCSNNRCSYVFKGCLQQRLFSFWLNIVSHVSDAVLLWLQDPDASYDFNNKDHDPFPRYDATGENKYIT